ncbi:MAG: type II secretion system protein [Lachnospiraceae bacterium]|nr:type II secretion system protein [Lachnospiraceae bacterium]
MKEKRISLRQSNKGFTLIEICVVLVIFSILSTIVVFNLISWQEYSTNMGQDQNAELIYTALRNKMAVFKANNTMDNMPDGIYYCLQGDYAKYKSKDTNLMNNKYKKLFFDNVIPYIYDKKMLNAYIVAEIVNGEIRTVLYSDRYNCTEGLPDNILLFSSLKSDSDKRYDNSVGMYSIE